MRLYVKTWERECVDAQETKAMLGHRLKGIAYEQKALGDGEFEWAFRESENPGVFHGVIDTECLEAADEILKRNPCWPYCHIRVEPVVTTDALVREAQGFLEEHIMDPATMADLACPAHPPRAGGSYWLAIKEVPPFSPLLPLDAQADVFRRTVIAQLGHKEDCEYADVNPVGRSVGVLVAEGDEETIRSHVETCEVYPDTVVSYTRLVDLATALERTEARLGDIDAWRRYAETLEPFKNKPIERESGKMESVQ
jgi:hypothetical protein